MAEAFALTAEWEGTIDSVDDDGRPVTVDKFRGANFALRTGELFNVGDELARGDGVIVTEDPELAELLRSRGELKSVTVPEGHAAVTPLASMSMAVLREQPEYQAVDGAGGMRKDEVVFRMTRARNGEDPNVPVERREDDTIVIAEPSDTETEAGDQA